VSLSKKSRRNIGIFNQSCNMAYRISHKSPLDSYLKAYNQVKNDTNSSEIGEVAGEKVS
jgi:hypothetical protein